MIYLVESSSYEVAEKIKITDRKNLSVINF